MKVYLISLGCAKNRVDSEVIIGNLVANEKVEITLQIYAHLYPNKHSEVAEKL